MNYTRDDVVAAVYATSGLCEAACRQLPLSGSRNKLREYKTRIAGFGREFQQPEALLAGRPYTRSTSADGRERGKDAAS